MSRWLRAAGIYNLAWGILAIARPHLLFDLTGTARNNYPEIWQCVGMIVGVYGVGYLLAANDPRRHWPIVLVGLLGKVFGPIGFLDAWMRGRLPASFGLTILTNDLIWWLPFGLMLKDSRQHFLATLTAPPREPLRFVHQSRLAASPETVFAFHERREALSELIPPWEPMRPVTSDNSLQPGSRVVLAGRIGPIPVRWVAEHTEYSPPHLFADRQVLGPFVWWHHRHHVLSDGSGGTILRDEIEYLMPLGTIGRWLGEWFIRRKLQRMFTFRHEVTRRWVESQAPAVADRDRSIRTNSQDTSSQNTSASDLATIVVQN
jgi:ligand-binding SRPBCC domain-containing protein